MTRNLRPEEQLRGRSESEQQNSLKLTNMEHQSKDIRRRGDIEREGAPPGMRLPAEMPGANPGLKQKREGQMFEAWREELNWGDRLRGGSAEEAPEGAAAQRAGAKKGAKPGRGECGRRGGYRHTCPKKILEKRRHTNHHAGYRRSAYQGGFNITGAWI